jgi:hypothetical protein
LLSIGYAHIDRHAIPERSFLWQHVIIVITTPPPMISYRNVVGFSEEMIRDAISYEIQRNGQVFLSIIN